MAPTIITKGIKAGETIQEYIQELYGFYAISYPK